MGCGSSKQDERGVIAPRAIFLKADTKECECATQLPDPSVKFEFQVVVGRVLSECLGMKIKSSKDGNATVLQVQIVRAEGLIPTWNFNHQMKPKRQIYEGDLIVEINGVRNNAMEMLEEAKRAKVLILLVRRTWVDDQGWPGATYHNSCHSEDQVWPEESNQAWPHSGDGVCLCENHFDSCHLEYSTDPDAVAYWEGEIYKWDFRTSTWVVIGEAYV